MKEKIFQEIQNLYKSYEVVMWSVAAAFFGNNNNGLKSTPEDLAKTRLSSSASPSSYEVLAKRFFSVKANECSNEIVGHPVDAPKVLVGGGSGFIGHSLVKQLKRKGYDVLIISRTGNPECGAFMEKER